MANLIQHKRSSTSGVVPTSGNLSYGELGINYADGKLYTKRNDNTIINLAVSSISGTVITPASGYLQTIQFNTNVEPDLLKGQVCWNDTDGTLNIAVSNDTDIHVGEHKFYRVKNSTGSILYKGQAVYATGVHSNGIITPSLYTADGSVREVRFIGLMLEDLAINNNGYVIDFGHLNIDTRGNVASPIAVGNETWAAGDILYIHPTVAGKLTKVEPKHSISVAIVLSAASNGLLFVRPTSYGHIDDNHDVNTSGVTNNQYLRYDSSSDTWLPTSSGIFNNVYASGNVGIGTVAPSGKLHVEATGINVMVGPINTWTNGGKLRVYGDDTDNQSQAIKAFVSRSSAGLNICLNGTSYTIAGGGSGTNIGMYAYAGNGNKNYAFYGDAGYNFFRDRVGIGTENPTTLLDVSGVITATGGNSTNWNTAFGWGNHASAGYQSASTALTTSTNFGGDVSGTYNNIVVADDSHNHIIDNVDGLQSELNLKAPLASPTFTGTPAAPTAASGTNTTQIATTAFVRTEISNLVDAAPGTLDTLNELAAALGDDPNFATTVTNSIATKANTNQTMYIGTTAVAINRTSASLSLTGVSIDGNAGTATSTTTLTSNGNLTTQNGNGTVGYTYQIVNGTTGLFSSSNNSNSILTLNRHSGNYYSQLGFSSNGNLYYRAFTNVAIDTTTPWQTIWTSSSLTNLNQLTNGPGYTTNTGTVTSVGGTGTVAGLTLTGTVTTTGSLTLGGTLSTPISSINDSTTVGQNLVKLTNPSAVRFLRINANNTVDALTDSQFRTAIGAGTSSTTGTVTSVGLSLPDIFNVSNSPISSSGTLSAGFVTQASNTVFAGPSSGNGTPSFRALVAADIPTLNQNTTGSAATLTTSRTLWGQSFNGSANVTGNMSSVGKVEQSWGDQRIGIFFNNDYRSGMAVFGNSRLTTIFSTTNDGTGGAITFNTRVGAGSSDTDYGTERMRITNTGDVGIGTTSPSHRLQLGTTTSTSTATPETISLGGTFSSSAGGNAKLRLWTDGSNVIGLGVSSNQLDYICSAAYSHVFYNNGSESWRITSAGVFQSNGAKTIQTSTGNLTLATAAGNGHILLSPHGTGNVGIGTASPAVRFHVEQNTTSYAELRVANTSTSARLNLGCGGSAAGADVANTAYLTCTTSDRFLLRNDNTNGYIDFATGGVSSSNIRMRLDNTGNLGIGTSTPSEILHLSKNDATIKIADKTSNAGVGPRVLLASNYGGTEYTASLGFSFYANDTYLQHGRSNIGGIALRSTNGTTRLYVQDSSGNVGIGVTDPDEKLEVNGNIHLAADGTLYFGVAGTNTRLTDDSGSNRTVLRARGDTFDIINAAGNAFSATLRTGYIAGGSAAGHALVLKSTTGVGTTDYISLAVGNNGGTEGIRIINNGNVGIGTTTPSYKLQVNGSFGATTKSFRIDHPSRPNYTLEYGSLESPYHGVRLTGRGKVVKGSGTVLLPSYLKDLIHDDETINIQITNIKHGKTIYVDEIDLNNDRFTVKADKCKTLGDLEFFWTFTGTRKDVDKLVVEAEK